MYSPPNELVFAGKKDSDVFCTLTLKNVSDSSTAYKVRGTSVSSSLWPLEPLYLVVCGTNLFEIPTSSVKPTIL